jgi:uncharacterized DUF497 family protein
VIFEWDPSKAAANERKHGVSFEEASTIFGDPLSDTFDDPDHSESEMRFIIIGHSVKGRLLFIAHRDDISSVRIISARELTSSERKQYERE